MKPTAWFVDFFRKSNLPHLKNFNLTRTRGFTLIELLIVIAILGILAAAVLVAIDPGKRTRQANDAKRKNDIGSLATELQGYYTSPGAGVYPASLEVLTAQGYLKTMPLDPTANTPYVYDIRSADTAEAAVGATLNSPTNTTGTWMWCWKSTTNLVTEVTTGTCTL